MSKVTGHTSYKGLTAQQHNDVFDVFKNFLSEIKPKRILSLDGGGIRGALTLGFLEKVEEIIREKENNPNLRLCDYFDLIGGTSTVLKK